jgi:hypothetical protein
MKKSKKKPIRKEKSGIDCWEVYRTRNNAEKSNNVSDTCWRKKG